MTSEGLGVMFEGDSADMCAGKFPLVSMGGRAGARTPIGASGNLHNIVGRFANFTRSALPPPNLLKRKSLKGNHIKKY